MKLEKTTQDGTCIKWEISEDNTSIDSIIESIISKMFGNSSMEISNDPSMEDFQAMDSIIDYANNLPDNRDNKDIIISYCFTDSQICSLYRDHKISMGKIAMHSDKKEPKIRIILSKNNIPRRERLDSCNLMKKISQAELNSIMKSVAGTETPIYKKTLVDKSRKLIIKASK